MNSKPKQEARSKQKMYKAQLQKLLALPKVEQKTAEWYAARNNLITASDFAQALGEGKFGTQKQLIEKKVVIDESVKPVKNIFFEWGNLFEPVACNVYSDMKKTKVHDFGLITHPKYNFFGASPDGITEDGIMLEIKCPFKRKISGEIPLQYYYQIQGQLDVCDLDVCDYFECEFQKYDNHEAYKSAYEVAPDRYTGVIRTIRTESGDTRYEYVGLQKTLCEDVGDDNTIYWILEKYNLQRVNRDPKFFQEKILELEKVWKKILFYRENRKMFEVEIKQKFNLATESLNKIEVLQKKPGGDTCVIVDLE